jgi:hypothetical protein
MGLFCLLEKGESGKSDYGENQDCGYKSGHGQIYSRLEVGGLEVRGKIPPTSLFILSI